MSLSSQLLLISQEYRGECIMEEMQRAGAQRVGWFLALAEVGEGAAVQTSEDGVLLL